MWQLNPVRARLVERAWDWPHSSVRAHLAGRDDGRATVLPLLDRAPRFADLLDTGRGCPAFTALRRSELIGRPLGDNEFQGAISRRLGRAVTPGKRGRKTGVSP
jgi:putative transposase